MKRIIGIIAAFAAVGLFAWTLLFLYNKSKEKPVHYKTETAQQGNIVKKTVATGSIVPRQEVEIKPRVSGVIEKLHVEAGQQIKKGDPIAKIKIIPNVVNLNNAESQLKSARISMAAARKELDRTKGLFERSLVAESELNRRQVDYDLRRQDVSSARANLELIRSGAAKGSGKVSNLVTSTVDGMVIEVPIKEGESVTETNNFNAGTTVAAVANMADLIFEGHVDESEVGKIKEGMQLEITIGAIETKKFKGVLEYIAPKGATIEGAIQFEIRAAIKLKEGIFVRANYSANANIVIDRRSDVLTISESLLQFAKDGKPSIEVETAEQVFERRDIQIGLSDGIRVEVLGGVSTTDKIKKPLGAGGGKGSGKGRGRGKR